LKLSGGFLSGRKLVEAAVLLVPYQNLLLHHLFLCFFRHSTLFPCCSIRELRISQRQRNGRIPIIYFRVIHVQPKQIEKRKKKE